MKVQRLDRVRLVTADATKLADFYQCALAFRRVGELELLEDAGTKANKASGLRLMLGEQTVELLQFDKPGSVYPAQVASYDNRFQHLALIVSDMDAAYAQLQGVDGWTPISTHGPQRLPASSGGVTAFKFRDPEGHPLELLDFPDDDTPDYWRARQGRGVFLGIDHSAISIADVSRSVAFYESMGLTVAQRSTNRGIEQGRLDRVEDPVVEVIAMKAPDAPPHVELLGYGQGKGQPPMEQQANDMAATSFVFAAQRASLESSVPVLVRDPDGHRSVIKPETD